MKTKFLSLVSGLGNLDPIESFANSIEQIFHENGSVTILDIGAGSGWYWRTGRLANLIENGIVKKITLFDATVGSIEPGRAMDYKFGIAPTGLNDVPDNSYDLVIALDLIEHLSRDDGYKLVYEMERISLRCVGIFTPNGFVRQPPSQNNPFNAHISGWTPKDMKELGFNKIQGHTGWRRLFGEYGLEKKNNLFTNPIWVVVNHIAPRFPNRCFSFSCFNFSPPGERSDQLL